VRVLLTGGAGFIGSHVADRLVDGGIVPRIFDLRPSPYHGGEVESIAGDLLDLDALAEAMAGCDAVAHLAAMADVDEVARCPERAESVNARGTFNVLEAARRAGVRRVVYASTIWVYPPAAQEFDEDSGLTHPAHLYTATKLAGEMYCRSFAELSDLEFTILRFGIPYGPRARKEAVVPIFVDKALNGEPLTIAGDGSQSRRFVYVEDLADGVVRALQPIAANRVYNLVGEEEMTIRQLAELVRDEVGDVEVVRVPGRSGDFQGATISGRRAERELGWTATTTFAEGVRRYVAWHRDHYGVEVEEEIAVPAAAGAAALPRDVAAAPLAAALATAPLPPAAPRAAAPLAAAAPLGAAAPLAAAPLAAAPPSRVRRAWVAVRSRAAAVAVLSALVAVLAAVLGILPGLDPLAPESHTTFVLSMAAFTGSLFLVPDPEPADRRGLLAMHWLAGVILAVAAVRWRGDLAHVLGYDVDLGLLGMVIAVAVAVGAMVRRALPEQESRSSG
jgi:UDP-glucose 4-epimerase